MKRKAKDGMRHFATLSRKRPGAARSRVLQGLLSGQTVAAAARSAGINRGTVHRWLKDPAFCDALEEGRKEVFSDALHRLKGSANAAIDRLVKIVEGKDEERARRAAGTLLTLSLKAHELIELEAEVRNLEGIVAAAAPPPKSFGG
jgi:transposase-like protein